ncbi:MAG: response regulator, partial [Phycisphaerae bacterium]|nr:response regulator [Phycisphaerae bacterium]
LHALRQCCVLDTSPEEGFDQITAIAAELAGTPIALVSLVDADRQWFKSKVGLEAQETSRDLAFCGYAILASEPLVIENATLDARVADNPLVTGPMNIRFYAGFPLELSTGERLGTLCVIDTKPRTLPDQAMRLLQRLAREAASLLELRRSVERLNIATAERETLITELREIQRQLNAASRAKSDFLANMSHEIRTPMTAILGYADLLSDPGADPDDRALYTETIQRQARHLLDIINDILDLSKIEAGKMTLESVDVSPFAIIGEVESLMRLRAEEKGLELRSCIETALPRVIRTDPLRLRQVITNLLANAIKFTERGRVTISTRLVPEGDDAVLEIAVADTGIGIAAGDQPRLFEAFEQADATTTRRFGGTGLGLRICKHLVTLLGGTITVASEPGVGSTFTVRLELGPVPAHTLVSAATGATNGRAAAAKDEPVAATLRGAHVLLAEDGKENQMLVRFYLEKAGASLAIVETGADAVNAVADGAQSGRPFDLVLMDVHMPEMDGREATRRIREAGYEVGIVALSAGVMVGDREECLSAGCDRFVPKPIDRAELIRCCDEVLRQRQS